METCQFFFLTHEPRLRPHPQNELHLQPGKVSVEEKVPINFIEYCISQLQRTQGERSGPSWTGHRPAPTMRVSKGGLSQNRVGGGASNTSFYSPKQEFQIKPNDTYTCQGTLYPLAYEDPAGERHEGRSEIPPGGEGLRPHLWVVPVEHAGPGLWASGACGCLWKLIRKARASKSF